MPTPRLKTPLACQVVRLDKQKFNEAVADGFFTCAPPIDRGTTRLFNAEALVPLWLFARLSENFLNARQAGRIACEVYGMMRSSPKENRIVFITSINGTLAVLQGSIFDADHRLNDRWYPAIGEVAYTMDFHVGALRKHMTDLIDEEFSKLGDDDA